MLNAVQKQMSLLLDAKLLDGKYKELPARTHRSKMLEDQRMTLEKEIGKYKNLKEKLYEDFSEGVIEPEDYEELKQRFSDRITRASRSITTLDAEIRQVMDQPSVPPEWLEEIRQFGTINSLTRRAVVMLINKVIVYSKDRIEIIFNYDDEIAAAVSESVTCNAGGDKAI